MASSLTQAVIAELIAEQVDSADPPTYFLAAMLQDVGILAMLTEVPLEYTEHVLDRAKFPNVASAERSHFGFSHVDVSVEILERWGLGPTFAEAVQHHHDRVSPSRSSRTHHLGVALQAASLGTTILLARTTKSYLDSNLRQWIGFLQSHFALSSKHAQEMVAEIKHRVDEYSALFSFQIGESIRTEEVIDEAKNLLQEIALSNQLELMEQKSTLRRQKREDDEIYRDSLSGLYNRRYLNEQVNEQLEVCIAKRKPIACLFLDVDKFKSINDSYGHATGDLAIQHVANWLVRSVRKNDVAIRLGGDEFLVILQQVNEKAFEKIAARIASEIPPLPLNNGSSAKISLSVGCTFYQPIRGDVADANWLIDQSDKSMYRAKRNGGDAFSVQKFVGRK